MTPHNLFNTLQDFEHGKYYSLPQLEKAGVGPISKLPVSIRVVLESVLRNYDGEKIGEDDVKVLANWKPRAAREEEIPFVVARIVLQDFTGVPLLVDLAAMRSAAARAGADPAIIEPLVPVDLVVDHSVQVDHAGIANALRLNMDMEFERNFERYQFLKWGMNAFDSFNVVPPGVGIVHQVNLEYLAKGVFEKDGVYYPDSLVGTDSHTTMINGLGIVGWGVGGIEAEAGMLGQPVYFLTPDVVGVNLTGQLREGVTATDLVLRITEMLRAAKVVGKFVEFHGEGAASLPVPDRATIGNMSPEYGATIGYFPIDEETLKYYQATGRSAEQIAKIRDYYKAQGLFGMPGAGEIEYSTLLELDLGDVTPSVAGPRRPQDRIELPRLKETFRDLLQKPLDANGFGKDAAALEERFPTKLLLNGHSDRETHGGEQLIHLSQPIEGGGEQAMETAPVSVDPSGLQTAQNTAAVTEEEMMSNRPTPDRVQDVSAAELSGKHADLGNGDVVIAAITSCTNTSNPSVMLAAGLVAKKAVERGMKVRPTVKTSLAPGSRVVTEYLEKTGLQPYLDQLGFNTVGYGCTTCIGNSGPLDPRIESVVTGQDLVVASVLSGNRNFEARIHQNVKANFLMSPPLVVAFALAGTVNFDPETEPLGRDKDGQEVYLKELWPTLQEVHDLLRAAFDPQSFVDSYSRIESYSPLWNDIDVPASTLFAWDEASTYIQEPPFFSEFGPQPAPVEDIKGARPLAIFGDSVTTDHISPAGAIKPDSPAGRYLQEKGVEQKNFNSYGSRRGNDRVMTRGTFANVRIKNQMVPGVEGGVTVHQPNGERMSIYDAAIKYREEGVPLVVFAGAEYGTGSSRDWAAKGTLLQGVRAVVATSFERIHRSNLIGMGVLPLQFKEGTSAQTLNLDGSETFDLAVPEELKPRQELTLVVRRADGSTQNVPLTLRIDTPIEIQYYRHGGILPYVLRQLMA